MKFMTKTPDEDVSQKLLKDKADRRSTALLYELSVLLNLQTWKSVGGRPLPVLSA